MGNVFVSADKSSVVFLLDTLPIPLINNAYKIIFYTEIKRCEDPYPLGCVAKENFTCTNRMMKTQA